MKKKLASLLVLTLVIGLMGNAYAHKSEVVGDYKIEVGWKNEPPVVGIDNEITLTVTKATAFDKAEAEKEDQAMEGMDMGDSHSDSMDSMNHDNMTSNSHDEASHDDMASDEHDHADDHEMTDMEHNSGEPIATGILKGFTADVMLGEGDYPLNFVEEAKYPGVYHAKFTPSEEGYPMVHISGNLAGEDTDVTFHPEKVEALNTLRPLQQMANGINPEDVQCLEGHSAYMRVDDGSALCLSPAGGERLMTLGIVEFF